MTSKKTEQAGSWDIFCRVVDNFGDAGVTWRLARLLVQKQGLHVRLWIDDLAALQTLVPELDLASAKQSLEAGRLEVLVWCDDLTSVDFEPLPQVVIEAFGCDLPQAYLQMMQTQLQRAKLQVKQAADAVKPTFWINLEYLSAESWVVGCHGLGSLQSNGLTRHFFFPGLVEGTGGLMLESDYEDRRQAFQNIEIQQAWCRQWRLPWADSNTLKVSLFAYENPALPSLIEQWQQLNRPVLAYLPEGKLLAEFNRQSSLNLQAGESWQQENVTLVVMPFLPQSAYDELLWLCDVNFVRGEESFVRAQWAGKPFVWHIYPTEDAAHWDKLEAFLEVYQPPESLKALMIQWNSGKLQTDVWHKVMSDRVALEWHADAWRQHLKNLGELSTNLVRFVKKTL
ncbi:elongation factor P maturation arginine rhamnosyltransferase EarP [Thiomicrorhabdus cannonii]|uniref:elongation factor P maturation arginine rhamnosyltransferase EarP n=1 Tax=Thiomicrorhabdus cannonii TaxID=2748011 RepID=UPI0015C123B4|nr:elongation factor P maturation arginine rhamnosyltransferase EarP [Thiomicrorhabdus cannonii]